MSANEIIYQTGLPEQFRSSAVSLYDEVFGKKLSVAVRSKKNRKLLYEYTFIMRIIFTMKKNIHCEIRWLLTTLHIK